MAAVPLVELKGVSKSFGSKVVLDQIDLTIGARDAIALVGPSGTGKTTILELISGLLAPDEGEVRIEGNLRRGVLEQGEDVLCVGMVFQQNALFDSLTVCENVGFALFRNSKMSDQEVRARVQDKLDLVGLPEAGDRYPAELSGGMKKRVSLARSLVTDPNDPNLKTKILLYDEPAAGLDPVASTQVENIMCDLLGAEEGYEACAIVTHKDSTIRRVSNRIVFLYDGQIQWDGPTDEAYQSDHPLLQQFFSASIEGPIG